MRRLSICRVAALLSPILVVIGCNAIDGRPAAATPAAATLAGAAKPDAASTAPAPPAPANLSRRSCGGAASLAFSSPIGFWKAGQRRGTNFFDQAPAPAKFAAARAIGIDFVRLATDKWSGGEDQFLLGDMWYYDGLVAADLAKVRANLDAAAKAGMPVVLTALRLPGLPYRNLDSERSSDLIWRDPDYRDQAVRYWRDLAETLSGHPALVGYNIINEPNPSDPAVLNAFYKRVIAAIREVDKRTPIMLDAPGVASPEGLASMPAFADPGVLYAFHFYEPVPYVFPKGGRSLSYPGRIDAGEGWQGEWNAARLSKVLEPVRRWQSRTGVPRWRIVAAEFGATRTVDGVEVWLADLIGLFNAECWSWAFYAFREDGWDGMNYEIGPRQTGNGANGDTPAFLVLRRALARDR